MAKELVKKTPKEKKPGLFARIKRFFRNMNSELKKTSWPTRKELVKYTGVVLAFIVVFAVVVGGIDYLLGLLVRLISG